MSSISRRDFLKTSAAVAGLSAASSVRAAGANERIRVGIIGCRNRGAQVAETFIRTGRFEIATLCDCDDAKIEAAMKTLKDKLPQTPNTAKDFRNVFSDKDIDAVVVAAPDHWHAHMTVYALDSGKHVYLEKPASYNIDEGKAMVAASQKHPQLAITVGTQQRSGQHFMDARQFIASGALGKIGFCRAWAAHDRPLLPKIPDEPPPKSLSYDLWLGPAPFRPYNNWRVHYNWHFVRDYGTGDMGNWGAHWLDVARWLLHLDLPVSVSGLGGKYVQDDIKEWPDTQTVLYEFPQLTLLWELRLWTRFKVSGMGGGVECGGDKGSLMIDRSGWTFYPKEGEPQRHGGSSLDEAHAVNFADAVTGRAKPAASIVEGHKSAILCHLGNMTATLNRRLRFDAASQRVIDDDEANRMMRRTEYRSPWKFPA